MTTKRLNIEIFRLKNERAVCVSWHEWGDYPDNLYLAEIEKIDKRIAKITDIKTRLAEWNHKRSQTPKKVKYVFKKEPVTFICEKKAYSTKELARKALSRIRQDTSEGKKPIRSYECPDCSAWHLTSKEFQK